MMMFSEKFVYKQTWLLGKFAWPFVCGKLSFVLIVRSFLLFVFYLSSQNAELYERSL